MKHLRSFFCLFTLYSVCNFLIINSTLAVIPGMMFSSMDCPVRILAYKDNDMPRIKIIQKSKKPIYSCLCVGHPFAEKYEADVGENGKAIALSAWTNNKEVHEKQKKEGIVIFNKFENNLNEEIFCMYKIFRMLAVVNISPEIKKKKLEEKEIHKLYLEYLNKVNDKDTLYFIHFQTMDVGDSDADLGIAYIPFKDLEEGEDSAKEFYITHSKRIKSLKIKSESLPTKTVSDILKDGKCSYNLTGKQFRVHKKAYFCKDCSKNKGLCICEACAKKCHKDHDLVKIESKNLFCDCGADELKTKCECL